MKNLRSAVFGALFMLIGLAAYAQQPDWVRRKPENTGSVTYFVGKSEPRANYDQYREAKGSALMDALTQYLLYTGADVESAITDYSTGEGDNYTAVFLEQTSRISRNDFAAGLYQQGEYTADDGTVYALYAMGNGPLRPELPDVFRSQRLRDGRRYFVGRAVQSAGQQAALAAQALEDARLQALIYMGGMLTAQYSDYYKEDKTGIQETFSAAAKFSSDIKVSSLSVQEEAQSVRQEADRLYHYYGLYSIPADLSLFSFDTLDGKTNAVEYGDSKEYFTYTLECSEASKKQPSFAKRVALGGGVFTRNRPYTARSGSGSVPAWASNPNDPPAGYIDGMGISENASADACNHQAAVRSATSIALAYKSEVSATFGGAESTSRQTASVNLTHVAKINDEAAGNTVYQQWRFNSAAAEAQEKAHESAASKAQDALDRMMQKMQQ